MLAYCEQLLSGTAVRAAATDAFARFRQEVVAANRLDSVNPEALLLRSTRRAALARIPPVATGTRSLRGIVRTRGETCGLVPELLAAHAEEQLSSADEERLARHLSACSACHDVAERFMRAEHAYRDPPEGSMPAELVSTIVAALAAASPAPHGDPAPVTAASPASNGEPAASAYRANGVSASEGNGGAPDPPPRQTSRADEAPTVVVPALELSDDDDEEMPSRASQFLTGDFALRVLTPGFVVAVGVVVALAIAGVFSSSKQSQDAASTPASVPAPVGGATLVAASHAHASTVPDNLAREAKLAQEKRRAAEEAARAARAAKHAKPPAVETTPSAGTTSPPPTTVTPRTTPTPTKPTRYSAQKVQKRTTKRPSSSPSPSPSGTQTTPGPSGTTPGN
ncbi:MAG: hypothetical protein QOI98_736 [Solirubrobacteraceae bacterium]|nr:hypothetical protein [Solirubrobacteraceae bacterium]